MFHPKIRFGNSTISPINNNHIRSKAICRLQYKAKRDFASFIRKTSTRTNSIRSYYLLSYFRQTQGPMEAGHTVVVCVRFVFVKLPNILTMKYHNIFFVHHKRNNFIVANIDLLIKSVFLPIRKKNLLDSIFEGGYSSLPHPFEKSCDIKGGALCFLILFCDSSRKLLFEFYEIAPI